MTNETGKKCFLKFFANISFEKVMIQSEVFHFAKEPGVSKVNSKNVEELLVSLVKSEEVTKMTGLRQGRKGSSIKM